MAVSRRLRYEILRRDNHTCRYCGATAPDVKLNVDHVTPIALGGTDDPTNLVTACADCNNGKSSTTPDAPLVADVTARSEAWDTAVRDASTKLAERSALRDLVCEQVSARWRWWLPAGWESSITAILDAGLAPETILEMITATEAAKDVDNRWKYFCGCCWRTLKKVQDQAAKATHAGTDARAYAPSNAEPHAETVGPLVVTGKRINEMWEAANSLCNDLHGFDLSVCECFGECSKPDQRLCRLEYSLYMLGWLAHESIRNTVKNMADSDQVLTENSSEVDRGTALDPS